MRDSFDVSDIPGTKLTPKKVEVRDSFNVVRVMCMLCGAVRCAVQ